LAAKKISNMYGGIPILEYRPPLSLKEMDIVLGDYMWEVKPGYTALNKFTESLKKYANVYDPKKRCKLILSELVLAYTRWIFR